MVDVITRSKIIEKINELAGNYQYMFRFGEEMMTDNERASAEKIQEEIDMYVDMLVEMC